MTDVSRQRATALANQTALVADRREWAAACRAVAQRVRLAPVESDKELELVNRIARRLESDARDAERQAENAEHRVTVLRQSMDAAEIARVRASNWYG